MDRQEYHPKPAENLQPKESLRGLPRSLNELLNRSIDINVQTIKECQQESSDPRFAEHLSCLSILKQVTDETSSDRYVIRGHRREEGGTAYIFYLTPENRLKPNHEIDKNGAIKFDLSDGPIIDAVVKIRANKFTHLGENAFNLSPSEVLERRGFIIDFFVNEISFDSNHQVKFSAKSGIGMLLGNTGKCVTYPRTYVGNLGYTSDQSTELDPQNTRVSLLTKKAVEICQKCKLK
jgi:hypothetical protein